MQSSTTSIRRTKTKSGPPRGDGAAAATVPGNPIRAAEEDYMSDDNESEFDDIPSDQWDLPSGNEEEEDHWFRDDDEGDRALRAEYKIQEGDRAGGHSHCRGASQFRSAPRLRKC